MSNRKETKRSYKNIEEYYLLQLIVTLSIENVPGTNTVFPRFVAG
jgi:hypothetical protein